MGALGALILAMGKRRLTFSLTKQALDTTAKLATFVMFILIGSTVFSFTFNAADGHIWVEHLFDKMPGGGWGFLIIVNILVFILGMFIDFFEIAFIVIPLLAPVAEKILPGLIPGMTPDAAMIWFGVIIAMNLQTSFLTPPFGFALFYLRSVAAKSDYTDRVTGQTIRGVSTTEIYKGSIAFIVLQVIMVAAVMMYPTLVTGNMTKVKQLSNKEVMEQLQMPGMPGMPDAQPATETPGFEVPALDSQKEQEATNALLETVGKEAPQAAQDPMKALMDAMDKDGKKDKN